QGIPVRKLKLAQKKYRELHEASEPERVPARYLMTDGTRVFYTEDASRIVDLTNNGQLAFAFVLDMEPINREVLDLARALSA
ncbi:MAG: hypothetical protein P8Z76_13880, partial [Alphaproteobacteria bacterium]